MEQLEQQRLLGELVAALDEPYRSLIFARYYRGESAAQIARRTGRPAGTVRSQLARGREQLRRRLVERSGGDFNAAQAVLMVAARGADLSGPTVTLLALTKGALAVNTSTKLVVAGIAAVAVVGALMGLDSVTARAEPGAGTTPRSEVPALVGGEVDSQSDLAQVEAEGGGAPDRAVLPVPADAAAPAAAPEPELDPLARVTARVIDRDGRPISGATLRYVDKRRRNFQAASEPSDGDGRVELALPEDALLFWRGGDPAPATYTVDAANHGVHFFLASARLDETTDLGEIELGPGGRVSGVVVDANNQPVAGAEVVLADVHLDADLASAKLTGPSLGLGLPSATTGAAGGFVVPLVAAGSARAWARQGDGAWTYGEPLEVVHGAETQGVLLKLGDDKEAGRITGRVVDPAGTGLAGMNVLYSTIDPFRYDTMVTTAADGSFSIRPEAQSAHLLVAKSPENEWRATSLIGVLPGEDVLLRVEAPRWMEVSVVDADGGLVPSAYLQLEGSGFTDSYVAQIERRGDGRFGVVVPEEGFRLQVNAVGFNWASSERFDPAAAPSELTIELERQPLITGRVTGDGEPVAGADVQVVELFDGFAVRTEGFQMHYSLGMGHGPLQTDAEGRFSLPMGASRTDILIVVRTEGWALTEWGPIARTAKGLKGVEIELARGGAIEGRLRFSDGRDPSGQLIAATRGDGVVLSIRTGENGSFELQQLTPGPWKVEHRMREQQKSYGVVQQGELEEVDWTCVVHEGQVTQLDIEGLGEVTLRGHLTLDDKGAEGWSATIELRDTFNGERPSRAALLDAEGRFQLRSSPGDYRLELRSPADDGEATTVIEEELTLSELESVWELALDFGTIEGRVETAEPLRFELATPGRTIATLFGSESDGAFRCEVPSGPGWLQRKNGNPERFIKWLGLKELVVLAGETVEVDID